MAYATDGTPVVLGTGVDTMGGMNGLLPLILGGALFGGQNGLGGLFGGNRGAWGPGMGAGGYYAGNVQGEQTGDLQGLRAQVTQIANTQGQDKASNEIHSLENVMSSGFAVACTSQNAGFSDVQGSLASIGRDYNNLFGQVNSNLAQANFSTLNSINGLGRDVVAQSNNNALQQLNSFNVLGTNMNQGFNNLSQTTQSGFNDIQNATQVGFNNLNTTTLTGFNNAAFNTQNSFNGLSNQVNQGFNEVGRDINVATSQLIAGQSAAAAAMAACCCDIKETIRTDGGLTRALIGDIRLADLQGQLSDAKAQVSNLAQTNSLNANNAAQTSVILQHISPILASLNNYHHNH